MDNYHPLYFQQVAPFTRVLLLESANEETQHAQDELAKFLALYNVKGKVWDNSIIRNRLLSSRYLIEITGAIPKESAKETNSIEKANADETVKKDHSILSPFNSLSDLFPNGILSEKWFAKYTEQIPFSYIQTFEFLNGESNLALANRIKAAKGQFLRSETKFVAIVISNSPDDEERVNQLRQLTGLPRLTGLIYLNSAPHTLTRDSELVVNTLLSNLRNSAIDFYSKIEHKIKQRHKKYYSYPSTKSIDTAVEISPKFLETRNLIKHAIINQFVNPHNLELSIKILESAYNSLVEIIAAFPSLRTCSHHDIKLYNQFRTLLDVLAFHIVRAYFSLEEPMEALKKHLIHVLREASSSPVHQNWVSVQYQWLAQLMELVPESIIASLNLKKKKSKVVEYFGGVRVNGDHLDTDIRSLYLKAASHMKFQVATEPYFKFLFNFKDNHEVRKHRLFLLKQAAAFPASASFQEFTNYQIAETLFEDGNIDEAIKHFEELKLASKQISEKLLSCYAKKNDSQHILEKALKLSCSRGTIEGNYHIDELEKPEILKIPQLFNIHALLFNTNNDETFMFDPFTVQLLIKLNLDTESFEKLTGTKIEVVVDQMNIDISKRTKEEYEPFKNVCIKHKEGGTILEEIEVKEDDSFADLSYKPKVIQFQQIFEKTGSYKISKIDIKYHIIVGEKSINLENNEEIKFLNENFHHSTLYSTSEGATQLPQLSKRQIRLNAPAHTIQILQCRPNISISDFKLSSLILGEKASIPIKVLYKPEKVSFDKLALSVNAKVGGEISTRISWDSLKDDENLELGLEEDHILHITLHHIDADVLGSLILDFKVHVLDQDVTVYDVAERNIPMLRKPFELDWSVVPRFRDDVIDMPSPFILSLGEATTMPVATRLWLARVKHKPTDLEIKRVDFVFKSPNQELKVEPVGETEVGDILEQRFTTRSINGLSHRNAPVITSLIISWSRDGGPTNEYKPPDFEAVLPLSDPRVLVSINEDEQINLKYILENPTPRIFTFTTILLVEDEPDWEFTDRIPFKQPAFPVLPFSQHVIEFKGRFLEDDKLVKLPAFKVFDVQYKVGLPSLPVTDQIVVKSGSLYWNR